MLHKSARSLSAFGVFWNQVYLSVATGRSSRVAPSCAIVRFEAKVAPTGLVSLSGESRPSPPSTPGTQTSPRLQEDDTELSGDDTTISDRLEEALNPPKRAKYSKPSAGSKSFKDVIDLGGSSSHPNGIWIRGSVNEL